MKDAAQFDKRMAAGLSAEGEYRWYDLPCDSITVSGLGFFEKERRWNRLPEELFEAVRLQRPALEELSAHMAGASLNFYTDSPEIWIRAELDSAPYMSHMTPTAQCGFDCYVRLPGRKDWLLAGVTKYHPSQSSFCCRLAQNLPAGTQVRIYFPLYIGVKQIQLGICSGRGIHRTMSYSHGRGVAFYGTSITQGGCATHPGMAYPAILERKLDIPVFNLGFSGNGVGDMCIADTICALPELGALVVDIEPNAGPEGVLERNLPVFLDSVRARLPNLPILVLAGTPQPAAEWDEQIKSSFSGFTTFEKAEVERRREAGDVHIFFTDPKAWMGQCCNEMTVDGIHLTDLGFYALAQNLAPILSYMLEQS